MTLEYVLFDWDGCLAKTLDVWLAAYKHVFGLYDLEISDTDIINICFGRKEGPIELGVPDIAEFTDRLVEYAERNMKQVSLHENADETLNFLFTDGATLGLLTSSKRSLVEPVLQRLSLDYYFQEVLTQDEVAKLKPDPEVVYALMDVLQADPEKTVIGSYGWPYFVGALTLTTLLVIAVTSIFRKRLKIKYQTWQLIHKLVYVALILGFVHALFIGSDTRLWSPVFFWLCFAGLVALTGIYYRVILRRNDAVKELFEVIKVSKETHNVHTVTLEPVGRPVFDFTAGQFAFVKFQSKTVSNEEHHFTIASAPEPSILQFTIKESGDFTSTIKNLKAGDKAYVEGPFGVFVNPENVGPIVFTAGGIGITPIMSMLRQMHNSGLFTVTTLIYANRKREDIAFYDELNELQKQSWFQVVHVLSEEEVDGFYHGHISKDIYQKEAGNVKEAKHFIVGPVPMIDTAKSILLEIGVPKESIFTERFSLV